MRIVDPYSLLLWLGLALLAQAILAWFGGLVWGGRRWARLSVAGALAALVVATLAGVLHYTLDHGPERLNPMGPGAFVSEHAAPLVIAGCALAVLGAGYLRRAGSVR